MDQAKPKPPPLHERGEAFAQIADRLYAKEGANDLALVQERFLGACQLLRGTALPKGHDKLIADILDAAALIELAEHEEVVATCDRITAEKVRHSPQPEKPTDEVRGISAEERAERDRLAGEALIPHKEDLRRPPGLGMKPASET